ncbi:MAG: hypothetical protein J6M07_06570, partial [Ruminococcus sp.]|nr:hypothetical protein [Ruminococcus sp.]
RIFRHNFVGGKAKIRRRAVALQGFLTQSPAKFDEKTCMNPYVDRFLHMITILNDADNVFFSQYQHNINSTILPVILVLRYPERVKSLLKTSK